jgi:hypothetical protein
MMLEKFLNLNRFAAPDCITGVVENDDAESSATGIQLETGMELAFESYEERDQEAGLSYASHHN